jgi:hypothetical protein
MEVLARNSPAALERAFPLDEPSKDVVRKAKGEEGALTFISGHGTGRGHARS